MGHTPTLAVSVQQPPVADGAGAPTGLRPSASRRVRWLLWGALLLAGVLGGTLIGVLRSSHPGTVPTAAGIAPAPPVETWGAGEKLAPGFALHDEAGRPVSLAAFRGRPVLLAFMDPQCGDFCPLEAKIIDTALARLPASERPTVVALSVNLWGNARSILRKDIRDWKLTPAWHWAVGASPKLRKAWADYQIEVADSPTTKNGVTTHEITHTEATFVIDRKGYQRAVYLYPFRAADLVREIRSVAATP